MCVNKKTAAQARKKASDMAGALSTSDILRRRVCLSRCYDKMTPACSTVSPYFVRKFQCFPATDAQWNSLCKFQLEFRRNHNLSANALLSMLALKDSAYMAQLLYADSQRVPSSKAGTEGFALRQALTQLQSDPKRCHACISEFSDYKNTGAGGRVRRSACSVSQRCGYLSCFRQCVSSSVIDLYP